MAFFSRLMTTPGTFVLALAFLSGVTVIGCSKPEPGAGSPNESGSSSDAENSSAASGSETEE